MASILNSVNLSMSLDTVTSKVKELRINQYNQHTYNLTVIITDQGYKTMLNANQQKCVLAVITSNENNYSYTGEINDDGTVTFVLPQQLSWDSGKGTGRVDIVSLSTGNIVPTQDFVINVLASAYEDGVVVESDDFSLFSSFLKQSQEFRNEVKANAELAAESAEQAKNSADSAKQSAEDALMISIPDGTITTSKIAKGAITDDKLNDGAVITETINDGAVTTEKLANKSVTEAQLADGSVSAAKIQSHAVTSEKLYPSAVKTFTINDGAVTLEKLDNAVQGLLLRPYVSPEMYGAVGDGETDDTEAMLNTFKHGRLVMFTQGKKYKVGAPVIVYQGTILDLNGATLTGIDNTTGNHLIHNFLSTDVYTGYNGNGTIIIRNGTIEKGSIDLCHGQNILVENVVFKDCTRDHYFEICACKNVTIRDCLFQGMGSGGSSRKEYINIDNCTYGNFPWFASQDSVTYDGTVVDGLTIDNCTFERNGRSMEDAIGKHSYYDSSQQSDRPAKNITIRGCKIYNATDTAFFLLGISNLIIEDCYIENCRRAFDLRNVFTGRVSGNNIKGSSTYNYISYCDDVVYTNNYNVLPSNVNTHDVFITGRSNRIEYSNNYFRNVTGSNLPITFAPSVLNSGEINCQSSTLMKITNNNYSVVNSSAKSSVQLLSNTGKTLTFSYVDDLNFCGAISSSVATNNAYDLTQFNRLFIQMGEIGKNTYTEVIIKSFHDRNFEVGEVYPFMYVTNSGSVASGTITITSEHKITSTGLLMRTITCQKLPRD